MKLKSQLREATPATLQSIAEFWRLVPEAAEGAGENGALADYLYPRLQTAAQFKQAFDRLEVADREIVYFLAVHGGGYLPAYCGRIDHAWGARSDCHADLPQPPTFYLRKVYFDTVVFTPHQLAELVRLYGADHVVMGTDYPFDMAEVDPIGHVASAAGFDASTVAALAGGNARRLLGI